MISYNDIVMTHETSYSHVSPRSIRAGRVLLAGLSTPCLLGLDFAPPLPAATAQLLARLPMGTSLKYMVTTSGLWYNVA